MILQRLSSALRQQHWTAILIELLVLIIGIFAGLQVDDWNQQRKERVLEQAYLKRLGAEITANRDESMQRLQTHQRRALTLNQVYWFLENGSGELPAESALQIALCRYFVLPINYVSYDVFNELLSTGGLSLIRDDTTRTAISAAYSTHQATRQQLELVQDTMHDLAVGISPFINWRTTDEYKVENTGSPSESITCEFDFEGMAADTHAMSRLTQLYRSQALFANSRRRESQADQAALDQINGQVNNGEIL
jgi:hypothetical protein